MPIAGTITLSHIGRQAPAPVPPAKAAPPQKGSNMLMGKAIKATVVLDPAAVAEINIPNGQARVVLRISAGGRVLTADIAAKGLRKAMATIAEAGRDGVAVIIQGKLEGDALTEAGIVAQLKAPKPAEAAG